MATFFEWEQATSLLWLLVLQCEQHLPLYHPITLVSMLDLAAALLQIRKDVCASQIVHRANRRLAMYLVEQEEACLRKERSRVEYHVSITEDRVAMLKAFTVTLRRRKRQSMNAILPQGHPVRSMYDCFLGDTISVLANCLSFDPALGTRSQCSRTASPLILPPTRKRARRRATTDHDRKPPLSRPSPCLPSPVSTTASRLPDGLDGTGRDI